MHVDARHPLPKANAENYFDPVRKYHGRTVALLFDPLIGIAQKICALAISPFLYIGYAICSIVRLPMIFRNEIKVSVLEQVKVKNVINVAQELQVVKNQILERLLLFKNLNQMHSGKSLLWIRFEDRTIDIDRVITPAGTLNNGLLIQELNAALEEKKQQLPLTLNSKIEISWSLLLKEGTKIHHIYSKRVRKESNESAKGSGTVTSLGIPQDKFDKYLEVNLSEMGRDVKPQILDENFNFI